jgi:hypothetical protein
MANGQSIVHRVREVILATFPNADVHDLMIDEGGYGRVTGVIVCPEFERMGQRKRQEKLWDALETPLSKADVNRLSLLMTVSPTEFERILAD